MTTKKSAAEEYFTMLVNKYSERLYWHVRALVGAHGDADDIVQESFLKVWQSMSVFRGDTSEFSWLWRIATNVAMSHIRKKKLRSFLSLSSMDNPDDAFHDDQQVDWDEAEKKLVSALEKLPEKQRLVFCMRYYEDLPYESISEITGTSVGSLKASYHIAYEKIKSFLSEGD